MYIEIDGGYSLRGTVHAQGAKNAALPILAATVLAEQPVILYRVPRIADVDAMLRILEALGARVAWAQDQLTIDPRGIDRCKVPEAEARRIRASNLFLGALLGRFGRARVPLPGGCAIGQRRMDLHEKGLSELGARIEQEGSALTATLAQTALHGAAVYLDFPSVGATENIMMAAVRAQGVTVLHNAAREPEVVDLAVFLNRLGAQVEGAGTDRIVIYGRMSHPFRGATHIIIPDRIEVGTLLLAGAITRSEVTVDRACPSHLEALLLKLQEIGFPVSCGPDWITIHPPTKPVHGVDLRTMTYPGFPTDLQPPMLSLLLTTDGHSRITETIFEARFGQVPDLVRMGAQIVVENGSVAHVEGGAPLHGALVAGRDLRATASLALAALAAAGSTSLDGLHYLERGYDGFVAKLQALGAHMTCHDGSPEGATPPPAGAAVSAALTAAGDAPGA